MDALSRLGRLGATAGVALLVAAAALQAQAQKEYEKEPRMRAEKKALLQAVHPLPHRRTQPSRTGKTILVTKNGRPVAELRAHRPPPVRSPIGLHKGRVRIRGDIVAPIGSELWDALK